MNLPIVSFHRFAFSVFAFLVGFGLQAALGSAWISQSRDSNGITEKANGVAIDGGKTWGERWESDGECRDFMNFHDVIYVMMVGFVQAIASKRSIDPKQFLNTKIFY